MSEFLFKLQSHMTASDFTCKIMTFVVQWAINAFYFCPILTTGNEMSHIWRSLSFYLKSLSEFVIFPAAVCLFSSLLFLINFYDLFALEICYFPQSSTRYLLTVINRLSLSIAASSQVRPTGFTLHHIR